MKYKILHLEKETLQEKGLGIKVTMDLFQVTQIF